jgi:molybdopterin-guanine dinucleotide biosynthesis protein A
MLLGIFVGGRAQRMGGVQKGLLRAPDSDESLVERLARIGREAGLEPLLVGAAELGPALNALPRVLDREPRVGPLSGLSALLEHAAGARVIAVACDMPRVSAALVSRLAHESLEADVLAPRDPVTGKWQPLCARYDADRVRPVLAHAIASGVRSFQAVFGQLSVVPLSLSEAEQTELVDWDCPEDMPSTRV